MARPHRIEIPGGIYHIMSRGNAKAPVFTDDSDYIKFIDILAKSVAIHQWLCHAYCLMSNHYHLLIETPEANLSSGMHLLNGMYTQAFNKKHSRTGHVFEGRFKSIIVEKESYLLELARYILRNPVRAGVVESPEMYQWSSYNALAGRIPTPGFLHTDGIISFFGSLRHDALNACIDFVNNPSDPPSAIREHKQLILGSDAFVEKMKPYSEMIEPKQALPHRQFSERPDLKELFRDSKFTKSERNDLIAEAYLKFGYRQAEIARATGMNCSSISRIIDRRS
jgi:REP element-mobilizing transposase RayT